MRLATTCTMLAAAMALSFAPMVACAQGKAAPEEMMGTIKVGDKAPDFTLKGHDGKEYTLSELTKKGRVALVFFRSANW